MTLVHDWTHGQASNCEDLGCSTVAGGLSVCQKNCLNDPECNLINFCPAGADCTSGLNRCCPRKCNNDDYQLTNQWKGWDIYVKGTPSISCKYQRYYSLYIRIQYHLKLHYCFLLQEKKLLNRPRVKATLHGPQRQSHPVITHSNN